MKDADLIQQREQYKRKIKRAKKIMRVRRKNAIDNWFKSRVYMIIVGFLITISVMFIPIMKLEDKNAEIQVTHKMLNTIIDRCAEDSLFVVNEKLVHIIDSIQINEKLFRMQYMNNQKEIHNLHMIIESLGGNWKPDIEKDDIEELDTLK